MKTIDKYILTKFLTTYVFVVFIILAIVGIIDYAEKIDKFNNNDVPGFLILKYYLTFLPWVAGLITPITVFIATVFVTAKMAGRTEIIAILASGVSYLRFMVPYMMGAIIVGLISFALNGWVIPNGNKFRIGFEIGYLKKPYYFTESNIHFKVGDNDYAYIYRYNNRSERGYLFTLEHFEGTKLKQKLKANTIAWDSTTHKWKLESWQMREFNEFEEIVTDGSRIDTVLNIRPEDFENTSNLQETLTIPELNELINLLQSRGADDVPIYQIEKYIRYMSPFTVLILTFIGVIMSSRKARGGTGFQIALGFLLAFIFIIFYIFAKAIAEAGSMNRMVAVWIPNIVFTFIGLVLYKLNIR